MGSLKIHNVRLARFNLSGRRCSRARVGLVAGSSPSRKRLRGACLGWSGGPGGVRNLQQMRGPKNTNPVGKSGIHLKTHFLTEENPRDVGFSDYPDPVPAGAGRATRATSGGDERPGLARSYKGKCRPSRGRGRAGPGWGGSPSSLLRVPRLGARYPGRPAPRTASSDRLAKSSEGAQARRNPLISPQNHSQCSRKHPTALRRP